MLCYYSFINTTDISEDSMRKLISSLLLSAFIAGCCTACKSSPKLDLASFEKYALSDLHIEKKEVSAQDHNAYYDLDYTINNEEAGAQKRDHTAQVYSTSTGAIANSLVMIYNDYQDEKEAKQFFEDLVAQEESLLATKENSDQNKTETLKGDNYLLVLTAQNGVNWRYECMYYQKDVILFASVLIGTSDISNIDKEWLGNIKKLFSDLNLKNPFTMTPEINKLV